MGSTTEPDPLAELRAENARLVDLLDAHGIDWPRVLAQVPI